MIGKNILGDEFSGGISGFLGLSDTPTTAATNGAGAAPGAAAVAAAAAHPTPVPETEGATAIAMAQGAASAPAAQPPHLPPSMVKSHFGGNGSAPRPRLIGERPVAQPATERPPFDPDGT